jgi:ribosomal protein L40E
VLQEDEIKMPNESLHVEPHHERLDADAVCERCGTVNPEDTLLCKTCGNNLRDQRMRRIAAGGDAELGQPRKLRWSFLASALTALGLLLILWLGLNAENVAESVFSAGAATDMAREYWVGPGSRRYDELKQQLLANPVTASDVQAARANPIEVDDFSGRYAIFTNTLRGTPRELGAAIVRQEENTLYFVAQISGGQAEVRGQAGFVGESTPRALNSAAIMSGREYMLGSGVALKRGEDEGGFVCHVQGAEGGPITVLIFKIP